MAPRDDATQAQVDAAAPTTSTWLSANAGSGKTRVLTDRVARLLLGGTDPQQILCLTYTKAAAGEMQNRLFSRLGEWAMLEDKDLRNKLTDLGEEGRLTPEILLEARRLFARAIETPGGLKIQTIHSFCGSVLRRFPLEAGVSPQFKEIEEGDARHLMAEVLDEMADGADAELVQRVVGLLGGRSFVEAVGDITSTRRRFSEEWTYADICREFDVDPELTEDDILSRTINSGDLDLLGIILKHCLPDHRNDRPVIRALSPILQKGEISVTDLADLEGTFIGSKGAKVGAYPPSADAKKAVAAYRDDIDEMLLRVEAAAPQRHAFVAAQRTFTLNQFARAFLRHYSTAKERRGWLDFDDLILKTRALLADSAVSQWILWRLDGGISHILVDEAQDTSPEQWGIIQSLAGEMGSGEGSQRAEAPTIFAVGDRKQSIYSFQGADPESFDRMREHFRVANTQDGRTLQDARLEYSFRSSPAILNVVDQALTLPDQASFDGDDQHKSFHSTLPGRVDLWPVIEKPKPTNPPDWFDPDGFEEKEDENTLLAVRIAHQIKAIVNDEVLPVMKNGQLEWRNATAGDILILTRRRKDLYYEIIRVCKKEGIEVAGADRLKLGSELAVRDILALLSFLALPENDLALANALKSPLFGWTDKQLFDLAHDRGKTFLWSSFRTARDGYPSEDHILADLIDAADFLRPYDLIERLLTVHDGRKKLIGRLGKEAEEGIDALLQQALSYEQSNVPSLTGFLEYLGNEEIEIKRRSDGTTDALRIMTIHGAKGLEAPIVIMPETQVRRPPSTTFLHKVGDRVFASTNAAERTQLHEDIKADEKQKYEAESARLLYVGMTRAENWLIIGAAGDVGKTPEASWYNTIEAAMEPLTLTAGGQGDFTFVRHALLDWTSTRVEETGTKSAKDVPLPAEFLQPDTTKPTAPLVRSPSDLGGAKVLSGGDGQDGEAARHAGTLLHKLLEHLPRYAAEDRKEIGQNLIAKEDNGAAILSNALEILNAPETAPLFASDGLTEVEITGTVPELGGALVYGSVDRLIVEPNRIRIIDFKSNRRVPDHPQDTPDGILRQMGAYRAVLSEIYPDHEVELIVLWTATGHPMTIPHDLVSLALERAT